jgi:hypothetical protein
MESVVIQDPEVFNKKLLDALLSEGEGFNKSASDIASSATRRRLRESGFMRSILPMKPVSASDLGRYPSEEENLFVVDEMEPDQPPAVSLPLNDSARSHYFRGQAYVTRFFKISTPEFVKNIHELKVPKKIDLQEVVTANALKDVSTKEDSKFIGWVDAIIGAPDSVVPETGFVQNFDKSSVAITRENYARFTLSNIEDRELNNGIFLMNRRTIKEFIGWGRDHVGGDLAQDMFLKGASALSKFEIMGVPHLATMKRDLVADGEIYQFAEPDAMGKAYSLQDLTMYVKREKNLLRLSAEEIIGVTIANLASVGKVTFDVTGDTSTFSGLG